MTEKDKEFIRMLQEMRFKVVIKNVDGKTLSERYDVYQNVGFDKLKRVILADDGTVIGLQG